MIDDSAEIDAQGSSGTTRSLEPLPAKAITDAVPPLAST